MGFGAGGLGVGAGGLGVGADAPPLPPFAPPAAGAGVATTATTGPVEGTGDADGSGDADGIGEGSGLWDGTGSPLGVGTCPGCCDWAGPPGRELGFDSGGVGVGEFGPVGTPVGFGAVGVGSVTAMFGPGVPVIPIPSATEASTRLITPSARTRRRRCAEVTFAPGSSSGRGWMRTAAPARGW